MMKCDKPCTSELDGKCHEKDDSCAGFSPRPGVVMARVGDVFNGNYDDPKPRCIRCGATMRIQFGTLSCPNHL